MAPILHGRVLPETDSSGLVRRELRILIDPRVITGADVPRLIDLGILREYVRTLSGPPCVVTLLTPASGDPELALAHEILGRHGAEPLPFGSILVPEATAALGEPGMRYPEFRTLVSTAFASDADVVVTRSPGVDVVFDADFTRRFSIVFGDLDVALRDSEVFVRGHEVPWSFRSVLAAGVRRPGRAGQYGKIDGAGAAAEAPPAALSLRDSLGPGALSGSPRRSTAATRWGRARRPGGAAGARRGTRRARCR
jgi:hypothetical protein